MEDQLSSFLTFLSEERNYSENTTAAYRDDLGQFLKWMSTTYPHIVSWQAVTQQMVAEDVDVTGSPRESRIEEAPYGEAHREVPDLEHRRAHSVPALCVTRWQPALTSAAAPSTTYGIT